MAGDVVDESRVDEIIEMFEDLSDISIYTGIIGEGGQYKGTSATVLDIADIHEFGKGPAPERSFLRATYDSRKNEILEVSAQIIMTTVMNGGSVETAFNNLGQLFADWTQEYLRDLSDPPLLPETIKKKGSSSPLIDTGQLINSIDYKVVKG